MTQPPTPTAERYLDVLRTLGVSDAAVRRQHDVEPAASLPVRLTGALSAPTDQLLDLLAATGVVLDLDAVTDADADRLELSLARFGYDAECTTVGDDVEVVARDVVADTVSHLRAPPERDPLRAALRERLLDDAGVVAISLVDGRTLVAERGALAVLQDRYGTRLEPFATPLLSVDTDVVDAPAPATNATPSAGSAPAPTANDSAPATPTEIGDSNAAAPRATDDASPGVGSDADSESPDVAPETDATAVEEVLASLDEETTATIQAALAEGGPDVHTAEDTGEDLDAAREARIGGGPRRTVSATGIDEVFGEIEAAAESEVADRTENRSDADDPFTTPVEGGGAAGDDGQLAGGGPTRTVSETSADDILARAGGKPDFDDIADEEGDADPDAVLDDDAAIPALEDGQDDDGSAEADDGEIVETEDNVDSETADDVISETEDDVNSETADDVTPETADDGDVATDDDANAGTDGGATVETTDGAVEEAGASVADAAPEADPAPGDAAPDPDADGAAGDEAVNDATSVSQAAVEAAADAAPPADTVVDAELADFSELPSTADGDASMDGDDAPIDDGDAPTDDGDAPMDDDDAPMDDDDAPTDDDDAPTDDGPGLGDALVGEDVEVRKGTEEVDVGTAATASAGRSSTDGPLAAMGGVSPAGVSGSESDSSAEASPDRAGAAAASESDSDESAAEDGADRSFFQRVRSVFRR